MTLHAAMVASPVGDLLALTTPEGTLVALPFLEPGCRVEEVAAPWSSRAGTPVFGGRGTEAVAQELGEYFAGRRTRFTLLTAPQGTDFQRRVWEALREIPYGSTASYGALAARVGSPGASRAVGAANGANPIPIVIPCHRVIGADGSLTGYGGGIERKRRLLALEGALEGALAAAPGRCP